MTSTDLTTNKDKDALAEYQKRTGGGVTKTNFIKLDNRPTDDNSEKNPDYGKLFAYRYEDGEETKEEIDIKKARFLPVKFRVQIRCTDMKDGKAEYWAREVDKPPMGTPVSITLFNQDKEEVKTDLYKNLKEEYNLKFFSAVYVEYNGYVYRWLIGGTHLGSWFDVEKIVASSPHYFMVIGMTDEKTGTNNYKSMQFGIDEPAKIADVLPLMDQVDASLSSYYKKVEEEGEGPKQIEDANWDEELGKK